MLAVTVGAGGGHGIAAYRGLAVEALAMRTGLGFMAVAATDKLELLRVPTSPGAGQVCVAFHAGQVGVNGRCTGIFRYEDGYFLVPAVAGQVRFGVTPQASFIVLRQCGACRPQEDRGDCEEPAVPMTTLEEPRKGRVLARTQNNAR